MNSIEIAEAYYEAMGSKNTQDMAKYLHPDVQFIGPLSEMKGKDSILDAAKRLVSLYKSLSIRAKFGSGDQAMIVYDLDCSAPIGNHRVAALMNISRGLIEKIELFYDARPFEKKKEDVVENNPLSNRK